jgi:hypothetical protein
MKKLLFLLSVLTCSLATFSQNATLRYDFDYGFNEIYWASPSLVHGTCAGLIWGTLPISMNKNVAKFSTGCGLAYNDKTKNFLNAGSYTIELYFKLDSIQGYKKLVDFDSLSKDPGLYNQNGKVVLYPNFTSPDSVISAGTYHYVAITRDAATKAMYINYDGKTAGTYTDNLSQYVLDSNQQLIFFKDDHSTSGEQSSGEVAMIHISNYAMDSTSIKTKYGNLHGVLNVSSMETAKEARIYPNPATDEICVAVRADCNYSITDIRGKIILKDVLRKGDNKIFLNKLSEGIYLLNLADKEGIDKRTYKFVKQ